GGGCLGPAGAGELWGLLFDACRCGVGTGTGAGARVGGGQRALVASMVRSAAAAIRASRNRGPPEIVPPGKLSSTPLQLVLGMIDAAKG
ncbi:unnamed protein product, partial [Discosporangium mesarthrocarpum]